MRRLNQIEGHSKSLSHFWGGTHLRKDGLALVEEDDGVIHLRVPEEAPQVRALILPPPVV